MKVSLSWQSFFNMLSESGNADMVSFHPQQAKVTLKT